MNEQTPALPEDRKPADGLEVMCAGILRTRFGQRESSALQKAMIRLEAEEAARPTQTERARPIRDLLDNWLGRLRPAHRFALGMAMLGLTALAVWFLWSEGVIGPDGRRPQWMCKLSDSLEPKWEAKSPKPKSGDTIGDAWLRLESGVIELSFYSGAKVAIEGPAQFRPRSINSLELLSGKISADVPRRAHGFLVKSPTASVVDLGTRFGESVNSEKASEVDVFQGKVQVTAAGKRPDARRELTPGKAVIVDGQTEVPATALPESAFPQPNLTVLARPQNCGFDVSARAVTGDVPTDFGYWSGPAFVLCGPAQDVRPVEGPGMLHFLPPPNGGDSEVWQLIDMRPFRRLLASGVVQAELSSMFNRVRSERDSKFGLSLAAFHGPPVNPKALWLNRTQRALLVADKELSTDNDPATWEKIEVLAKLPPETDFVIIQIRAIAPSPASSGLFPGHFADLVDFKLCTPMRGSTISTSR